MNRRGFMKLLACTPLIGLGRSEQPERIILIGEQPPQQTVKWSNVGEPRDWDRSGGLHEGNIALYHAELKALLHDYPESMTGIITPKMLAACEPKNWKRKRGLL